MDKRFVNQYKITKEFYKEFHFYYLFRRNPVIIIPLISLTAMFFIGVYSLFDPKLFLIKPEDISRLFFGPIFFYAIMAITYFRSVKISLARELEKNKGDLPELKFTATDEGVEVYNLASGSKHKDKKGCPNRKLLYVDN